MVTEQLLDKSWFGHAMHCVSILCEADETLLFAVHSGVANFRVQGIAIASEMSHDNEEAMHALAGLVTQWSACLNRLTTEKDCKGALEWLRQDGRAGLSVLGELQAKYVGEGVESTQVRQRLALIRN